MGSDEVSRLLASSSPYLKYVLIPAGIYAACKLFSYLIPGPQHHKPLTYKDKTVLITGASTGLGRNLAFHLYARGAKLILLARSIDKLKELCEELKKSHQGNPHEPVYRYLDICEPTGLEELPSLAIDGKTIDILINNAGLSMRGSIMDTPLDIHKKVMEVNYFGHIAVTRALISSIPDDGCIIVTSSMQGKIPVAYRSSYAASKHALQAFFDTLRSESRPNLHILVVSAGYLNTGFGAKALDVDGKPIGKEDQNQLKFCNYRGYIKLNRSKFDQDMKDLKRTFQRNVLGKSELAILEKDITSFVSANSWLLSGFAAGMLVGFGLA